MIHPIRLWAAAGAAVLLSSCVSSPLPRAEQEAALKQVAGEWVFSGTGPASIDVPMMVDPGQWMTDFTMTIGTDGRLTSALVGASARTRVTVMGSSAEKIELYSSGMRGGEMVYDRKTGVLTSLSKVKMKDSDGVSRGTMPVYFRKVKAVP